MFFTRGNRQLGYAIITDPAAAHPEEQDSMTCGHCGTVTWMKPFQDGAAMGGHCTCCDKFICLRCVGKGCTPLEKRLELYERRRQNAQVFSPDFRADWV